MKNKKKLIIILVALVLVVGIATGVGAVIYKNLNKADDIDLGVDDTELSTKYAQTIQFEEKTEGTEDVTPVPIALSDKAYKEFVSFVDGKDTEYKFEKIYNIDATMKAYKNQKPSKVSQHSGDIRVNGEFDVDHFYKIVKKNTDNLMAELKKQDKADAYVTYSSKETKRICKEMIEVVNDIIAKNPDYDVDMASCFLSNVSIVKRANDYKSYASFDLSIDGFHFNYDNIADSRTLIESSMIDGTEQEPPCSAETETMYHEMFHLFQNGCPDIRNNNLLRTGVATDYRGEPVDYDALENINALAWYWTSEASAEMKTSQILGINPTTYYDPIDDMNILNYVGTLLNGKAVHIEDLSYSKSCDELFDIFGAKTDKEKEEIIKMMYTLQVVNSGQKFFENVYSKEYNVDLTESCEDNYMKMSVQDGCMMTLTKLFYKGLANQVKSGKATKQDVFCLMKRWEAQTFMMFCKVNGEVYSASYNTIEAHHDFYDEYLELQDKFLDLLCSDNGFEVNDIIDQFEAYEIKNVAKNPNADYAFFSEDDREYFKTLLLYSYKYPSMRSLKQMVADFDKNGYPIAELEADRKNYSFN